MKPYPYVIAMLIFQSCASLPGFIKTAEYDLETTDEMIKAEEPVIQKYTTGKYHAPHQK